ncbi:helix-turn-helix transcriptional regulator [Kitasatospora sp. NPDC088779]|uniref:helix-turn-helix transcriptional regulator n=1 Tax=unclassified Kitasatospora TaxID=2633591 RepID=UPI00342A676B
MSVNDLPATVPDDLRGLLASCRGRIEVSQEKLAAMVGVSGRHYGDFERGNVPRPSQVLLERVAAVLEMSSAEKRSMYELVFELSAA